MLRIIALGLLIELTSACTTTLVPYSRGNTFMKNTRFGLYECVWFNAREFCQEIVR